MFSTHSNPYRSIFTITTAFTLLVKLIISVKLLRVNCSFLFGILYHLYQKKHENLFQTKRHPGSSSLHRMPLSLSLLPCLSYSFSIFFASSSEICWVSIRLWISSVKASALPAILPRFSPRFSPISSPSRFPALNSDSRHLS